MPGKAGVEIDNVLGEHYQTARISSHYQDNSLTATNIPEEPAASLCSITLTLEAADSFETLPIYQITCHAPGDSNMRPSTDFWLSP